MVDEDSFTRLFPVKSLSLAFFLGVIVVFPVFSAYAGDNIKHQPAKEQMKKEKVETVASLPAPDMDSAVVVTPALGKKCERFDPFILKAANRHEVDPALIKAIIMVESRYNPHAVSKRGAEGLMQLMPRTARSLGVEDSFNPEHNVNGGVKYLKQLLNEFDDNLKFALAAYNAGSSTVRRYRGIPPIKATQYYVNRVFEYYQYYKNEAVGESGNV